MVQWLRLQVPSAGGPGWTAGQGTRPHMLQLKMLRATVKAKEPCAAGKAQGSQTRIFKS